MILVVQESVDINSKKLWECKNLSKTYLAVQEKLGQNYKRLLELEAQTSQFKQKWAALDSVENRVKSVVEYKFSQLKSALKDDLKEVLTVKVTAIQNMASNSISDGITKLKSELKKEVIEEVQAKQQTDSIPDGLNKLKSELKKEVTAELLTKQQIEAAPSQPKSPGRNSKHSRLKDQMMTFLVFNPSWRIERDLHGIQIATTYRLGSGVQPGPWWSG